MSRHGWIVAFLILPITVGWAVGGEPETCAPVVPNLLQRWHPVGGWNPYGGGLLHWWNSCCFPHCGAPDDYCRKTLPRVCWPPYAPYYIWGPPEVCCPQGNGCRDCGRAH